MTEAVVHEPAAEPMRAGIVARLAFLPAAIVARVRPDLRAANAQDAERFRGFATTPLLAVVGVAVLYPILASIVHRFGDPWAGGDSLLDAFRPAFDVVYAESIPFMLAAVGVGLFSPALGVLFMAVFIPADLWAASGSSELENYSFQALPFGAWLGRMSSYGLLWLLAVEIPLQARGAGLRWATGADGTSTSRLALGVGATAAFLTFLWATALPLLIMPVYTWSGLQLVARNATDPTWYHWPFLVGGTVILAVVAALAPRPLRAAPDAVDAGAGADRRQVAPARAALLVRQTLVSLGLALLLGGLITNLVEAIAVVGGSLLIGPFLTLTLASMPIPGVLTDRSRAQRGTIAIVLLLAPGAAVMVPFGAALFSAGYLPFIVVVFIAIATFRIILEGGAAAGDGSISPGLPRQEVAA